MYELVQVAENSFYMDCPAKAGFFRTDENTVVLIDSGSDRDAAKRIKRILDARGWRLTAIFNTHSHADHIGGNRYLQTQTGCRIYAPDIECAFTEYPVLEPALLYGGCAPAALHNKFLMAAESSAERLTPDVLPEGLEVLSLPGHSCNMAGFRTADDVVFLADSVTGAETLQKYGIGYLYDVGAYLRTLETVREMKARCFVPSHAAPVEDIAPLAQLNTDRTLETAELIVRLLTEPRTFEDLLAEVFNAYGLTMTIQQNVLIGSTVRSFLSWLESEGRVAWLFSGNRMLWRAVQKA